MAYVRCKYLMADASKTVRERDFFRCSVEIPQPVFPVSVTKSYDFHWPLHKSYVGKSDCAKCPMFDAVKP